jgi:GT2 family glycosyltransferase
MTMAGGRFLDDCDVRASRARSTRRPGDPPEPPGWHWASSEHNLRPGGRNNVGLALATPNGDVAARTRDNDTLLDPGALEDLGATIRERPDFGNGGAIVETDDGQTASSASVVTCHRFPIGRSSAMSYVAHLDTLDALAAPRPDCVNGFSILRRMLFDDVGAFEEGFHLYCEEIDIAARGRRRGWSLAVAASSFVRHELGRTAGSSRDSRKRSTTSGISAPLQRYRAHRAIMQGPTVSQ